MESKICPKCQEDKPLTEFHRNSKKPDGRQSWCKVCNTASIVKSYKANPKVFKDRSAANKAKIQHKMFEYLNTHPCIDCGESDPIVLEFDHLEDKKYTISHMVSNSLGWNSIIKEMSKCVVRCANCHRRKTSKEQGNYKHKLISSAGVA